jgi:hypothetical protein
VATDFGKTLLEVLKLSPKYLAAPGIASAALLFAPSSMLHRLGVDGIVNTYRGWIGLALVAILSLTIAAIIGAIGDRLARSAWRRKVRKLMLERLATLTEPEKEILRYYFAKGTRSNRLRIDDGTVRGLVHSGIIYRSASMGNVLSGFDHNITEEALVAISNNPSLLNGTGNFYRTDADRF